VIYISGPGHGAPATLSNCYLEGVYSEVYPDKSQDVAGLQKFLKQFSFPGGIGSHCTPETPGSIHEGGELGYSLSHGFGAAFDNPDLIVTVAVGDGESETGPLATSWHSNKFLDPVRDGAVLPILHLNGYKIANPTILARIPADELEMLFKGLGWTPHLVEGDDPDKMHPRWPRCWKAACSRSAPSRRRPAGAGRADGRAAEVADDHSAHAQRLDWPKVDGWAQGGRLLAGAPDSHSRSARPTPRTWRKWKPGYAAIGRRSCSTNRDG
jgi:phosphoketolase